MVSFTPVSPDDDASDAKSTDNPILLPAIKTKDGKVVSGTLGDHHDDIDATGQRGFVDQDGKFLNRKEGGKVMQDAGHDVPDNLHSENLNKALGVEKRTVRFIPIDEKKPSDRLADQPDLPKFDVLGSIGRAARGSADALKSDIKTAFPSVTKQGLKDEIAQEDKNRADYGVIGGGAKNLLTDVERFGAGAKIPLDALGVLASPVTGLMHAGPASALSYLPGQTQRSSEANLDQALSALGPEAGGVSAALAPVRAEAAAKVADAANPKFAAARQAGYVVPPIEASEKPGILANTLSALGGKLKTQQLAATRNQTVTNDLAAKDLGLPADTLLDEKTFSMVRQNAGKAYEAVKQSMTKLRGGKVAADDKFLEDVVDLDKRGGTLRKDFPELALSPDIDELQNAVLKQDFSPEGGVEAIKRLRFKSRSNLKSWDNPEKLELGMAQRDAASSIEDLIERRLAENGDADTVKAYQAARQTIAKSHDIESATDAAGNVDARKIARLGDKRPFTGGLKTIADTASAFPKAMQNVSKVGGYERIGITDLAALAVAPHKLDVMVAILGRPLARSAALSEGIQNRLAGLRAPQGFSASPLGQSAPLAGPQNQLRAMAPGVNLPSSITNPQQQPTQTP